MTLHSVDGWRCPNCRKLALMFYMVYEGHDLYKCAVCGALTRHRFAKIRCGLEGYNYQKRYRGHRMPKTPASGPIA